MSSAIDEDTARAIQSGRESLGAVFVTARDHLRKVFLVFLAGFLGAFYALFYWVWDFLEATAKAEMGQYVADQTNIITRTPFEVILLQAKIGMIVGVVVAVPALVWFARDELRERGFQSAVPISKTYAAGFGLTSLALFCVGVVYAYGVFFPFAFDFLAGNAVSAGVKPSYGITEFTEFVALLTISFGLAAQLPLFMSVLSYTEIVAYETFRDKWRHAVVAITVFGAMFSPPDPFTLVMWAMPLVGLYVFSLGLAKLVANIRRRGTVELDSGTELMKRRALQFGGALAGVFVAVSAFTAFGGFDYLDEEVYPLLPGGLEPGGPTMLESIAAEYGALGPLLAGAVVAVGVGLLALLWYTVKVLRAPVYPREEAIRTGDPAEIDLDVLDAEAIEAAPPQVFLEMTEEEALDHARTAMYDDDREKAQAILDRFDRLQASQEKRADIEAAAAGAEAPAGEEPASGGEAAGGDDEGSLLSSTAAGMIDPFTEDETTEDDIGGYAYDIAFIVDSLTSKMFRIVAVFMLVLGGSFFWLYQGGLGLVLERFLDRVPDEVLDEVAVRNDVDPGGMTLDQLIQELDIVIALHPVEVLIFEVKVSTLAAVVAVLPLVLYYAWPAAKERGLVRGDRRVFVVWGGCLLAGFALGTYLGFFWIAPSIISYLVSDAIANEMVVSYRIRSFFWLVILTTVGIGFLLNLVVTMALFHVGGIVSYRRMLAHWRPVVVGIFAFAAVATPKGILTMLIAAIPIALTYVLGLAVLYALTAGGRLFGGGGGGEPEPEPGRPAE